MTSRPVSQQDMVALVSAVIVDVAGVSIDPDTGFFDAGLNSALLVQVCDRLADRVGCELPVSAPFRHPTARTLAICLYDLLTGEADRTRPVEERSAARLPVAGAEARRLLRAMIREGSG